MPGKSFLFSFNMFTSLITHLDQDSGPLYKLNLYTNQYSLDPLGSTLPQTRLPLAWLSASRVVQAEHLPSSVVALTNLDPELEGGDGFPPYEDRLIREMDGVDHSYTICMSAPLQVAWDLGTSAS